LENSFSFPIDQCSDDFFINWDPANILENIIKNPVKRTLFELRKRYFVFIIASQNDIENYLDKLPKIFDPQSITKYYQKYQNDEESVYKMEDLVSIRNALLLYKALKNEKIREVYLCVNGFKSIKQNYPYYCKYRTQFLYLKK
jgi:hypothetical protein